MATYNADGSIQTDASQTGLISSAKMTTPLPTGMSTTGAKTADGYTPAVGTATQGYDPTKWNVDDSQTVQGQVAKIIAADSPLAKLYTNQADQEMGRRGLINSSIGVGANQEALYKYATPIATSDAAMYGNAAQYNATGQTAAAKYGADATNNQNLENIAASNTALSEAERNRTSREVAATSAAASMSNAATAAEANKYNTDAQAASNEASRKSQEDINNSNNTYKVAGNTQALAADANNRYNTRADAIRTMEITPKAKDALLTENTTNFHNSINMLEATSGLEISNLLWDAPNP